jgi:hypothetical protein
MKLLEKKGETIQDIEINTVFFNENKITFLISFPEAKINKWDYIKLKIYTTKKTINTTWRQPMK